VYSTELTRAFIKPDFIFGLLYEKGPEWKLTLVQNIVIPAPLFT